MENYVKSFKQNFSANVYLTDKTFVSKEMINIEEMPIHDLYELFCLLAVSDLFITSKTSLANMMGELGYFVILLGKDSDSKNVKAVELKELFSLKNLIRHHLDEEKKVNN
jgi:hypothetical protein